MPESEQHGKSVDAYRVFFPLGIFMGVAGVSIWPLYYWNAIDWYNGRSHAFIQTDCFLYSFIVGFLWTAIPRFTGTEPPSRAPQFVVALLIAAQAAAFELRMFSAGHILFVLSHCIVITVAARRFIRRRQPPPETFSLVGLGLFAGLVGAVINAGISLELIPPGLDLLGKRLMTEGMVLLLVLGVGGFLGPRLLGFAQLPNFQTIGTIAAQPKSLLWIGWRRRFYVLAGVLILTSIVFEYAMGVSFFLWVRAAVVTMLVLFSLRLYLLPITRSTLAWCVWTAHWFLIVGVWLIGVTTRYRIDFMHVIFMGAFTLLVLAVGTRVVLSHGGHSLAAEARSWPLRLGLVTGFVAMLARVAAGLLPSTYFVHLAWAALFWMGGVIFWGVFLFRRIRSAPPSR